MSIKFLLNVSGDLRNMEKYVVKADLRLSNHLSQLLQNPGMHAIRPQRLVLIQSHEAVSDLLCSYSGRAFTPLIPT